MRIGKVIHGFKPLLGMFFAETQVLGATALYDCQSEGLTQLTVKETISFGHKLNQTCVYQDMNFPDLAYLIADKSLHCQGEQSTKFNEPVTNPNSLGNISKQKSKSINKI